MKNRKFTFFQIYSQYQVSKLKKASNFYKFNGQIKERRILVSNMFKKQHIFVFLVKIHDKVKIFILQQIKGFALLEF
ncbi:hypothetical protein TTHERM_000133529 (macronuclear) [Tetrahymena thermophila SB210]|uniref:Uncharacterized protein n=1 Tax=Tetrahymena thermophila (strain SB210) TaxID=312017 RepID=W7X2M0_TETTS|nr:hypothetical protein TTHERM_000133529 [Tetrahymena thermophila SB210]EWS73505.1 hypothetical protein TTHERM_000133529 [Tetrahymena thermophila SB210]|eukprot:XP_012653987.1 hypothetical protein TTHERM_000133529 [Tetrahymena thermophila SB210]